MLLAGRSQASGAARRENFRPVDGEEVLAKIRRLSVPSWNYIGHDSKQFRHYGPMAQDFFAAFGDDGVGTVGTPTTINSGDVAGILMIAAQALEKRTVKHENRLLKQQNHIARHDKRVLELEKGKAEQSQRIGALTQETNNLRAENADLKARLEALERRMGNAAFTRAE